MNILFNLCDRICYDNGFCCVRYILWVMIKIRFVKEYGF